MGNCISWIRLCFSCVLRGCVLVVYSSTQIPQIWKRCCGTCASLETGVAGLTPWVWKGCLYSQKDQVDPETCLLFVGKTSVSGPAVYGPLPPRLKQQWLEMGFSKNKSQGGVWLILCHSAQPSARTCDPSWRAGRAKESSKENCLRSIPCCSSNIY